MHCNNRALALVSFIVFAVGCESEVDKLQRLSRDKTISCLAADRYYAELDSMEKSMDPRAEAIARLTALTESLTVISDSMRQMNVEREPDTRSARAKVNRWMAEGDRLGSAAKLVSAYLDTAAPRKSSESSQSPAIDSIRTIWVRQRAECELATRKYEAVGR
jgi:hypothetical protein